MSIHLISPEALDAGLLQDWRRIQAAAPVLHSPFYTPEFCLAVHRAGRPVRIAVLQNQGRVVGFFAHEALGRGRIGAVGTLLNDYHGPVCEAGTSIDPAALLRACGARLWDYNHLPRLAPGAAALAALAPIEHRSPQWALHGGWQASLDRLAQAQGKRVPGVLKTVRSGMRKLSDSLGPLRFEAHSTDPQALAALRRWKGQQYRASGQPDVLALPWVARLCDDLLSASAPDTSTSPGLHARLATLWAGDTLVACHLGLQSGPVLHYWFPSYDPAHAAARPGLLLLHELARDAAEQGLLCLDLGRGEAGYKQRFMSQAEPLCEGIASRPAAWGALLMQARLGRARLREVAWVRKVKQFWHQNKHADASASEG